MTSPEIPQDREIMAARWRAVLLLSEFQSGEPSLTDKDAVEILESIAQRMASVAAGLENELGQRVIANVLQAFLEDNSCRMSYCSVVPGKINASGEALSKFSSVIAQLNINAEFLDALGDDHTLDGLYAAELVQLGGLAASIENDADRRSFYHAVFRGHFDLALILPSNFREVLHGALTLQPRRFGEE